MGQAIASQTSTATGMSVLAVIARMGNLLQLQGIRSSGKLASVAPPIMTQE
jgi:hypothetical protein